MSDNSFDDEMYDSEEFLKSLKYIEKYRLSASEIRRDIDVLNLLSIENSRYLEKLFLGTIPKFDGNGERLVDFDVLIPIVGSNERRSGSKAVLFTGEFGNGKHTAEIAYGGLIYKHIQNVIGELEKLQENNEDYFDINEYLRYYKINSYDLIKSSKKETCLEIDKLFDDIIDMARKEYRYSMVQYISLGDITEIMKKNKTAKCFTNRIKQLVNTPETTCIIDCIYEGLASEIPESYKAPFILNEFKSPDKNTRQEYIDTFKRNNNQRIVIDVETEKIVDMTESFTFKDMSELVKIITLTAKGTILGDGLVEYEEYIKASENGEDDKVTIEYDEIEKYIENVKALKYKPKVKSVPVSNGIASFLEPNFVNTNKTNSEEKPKEEKPKSEVKENEGTPDNLDELYKLKGSLDKPIKIILTKTS